MKVITLITFLITTGSCLSSNTWIAPRASDRRSPCPMVNSLANHGLLPRDGLNISMVDLIVAFNESINLAPAATQLVGRKALLASTTGSNATFNLDDINTHGVIEHDGSLSRNDIYFGDNHSFNSTIWNSVAASFTNKTISLATAISARSTRLATAAAVNPNFNMTAGDAQFSGIETALYMTVFADPDVTSQARTEWVGVLFRDERLPYEEGWTRSEVQLTAAGILGLAAQVLTG
ncbi:Chloroperoxidase [Rhexocercosporidium sp. MPI-PUGE-AT-0058]|nr:Chloroperoxidase [Rhexocercosporidium sp. MPI-PUGE-AT-0058]